MSFLSALEDVFEGNNFTLAVGHLTVLMMLPASLALVFAYWKKNQKIAAVAGIGTILSLPAYMLLFFYNPIDFLAPTKYTLAFVELKSCTVSLVQETGSDFYRTYFEAKRADGNQAELVIDSDDSKWWRPRVETVGNKVYFLREFAVINENTPWVDTGNEILGTGSAAGTTRMDKLFRIDSPVLMFE